MCLTLNVTTRLLCVILRTGLLVVESEADDRYLQRNLLGVGRVRLFLGLGSSIYLKLT